jgi:hypothetical protein
MNEQSKKIELPCVIGDKVFWHSPFKNGSVWSGTVSGIIVRKDHFTLEIIGSHGPVIKKELEKCFFSKEQAVEGLKNESNN